MLLLLRIFFVHSVTRRFLLVMMPPVLSTCYTTQCYATLLIAVNLVDVILRISEVRQQITSGGYSPQVFRTTFANVSRNTCESVREVRL